MLKDSSGDERRRSKRVEYACEAVLRICGQPKSERRDEIRAIAIDISEVGVRLKTYQVNNDEYETLQSMGVSAEVEITTPDLNDSIVFPAQVIWAVYHAPRQKDPGYCMVGLGFRELSNDQKKSLTFLLEKANCK